jgi:catechol 2,3-dioxygenase-like lactoylglutathione lyase family enzyme
LYACARHEHTKAAAAAAALQAVTTMPVLALDHVNIAGSASLIERCRTFYVDVLGLTEGHRPVFRSRGHWLYAGGHPIVHLTVKDGDANGAATALDHFAFTCEGLEETMARLREHGVAFTLDPARDTKNAQLFLQDPAGVQVELNFIEPRSER